MREGLAENMRVTRAACAAFSLQGAIDGGQDGRSLPARSPEPAQKIEAVHLRGPMLGDQAISLLCQRIGQKVRGLRIGFHPMTARHEQQVQGTSQPAVALDEEDHGLGNLRVSGPVYHSCQANFGNRRNLPAESI